MFSRAAVASAVGARPAAIRPAMARRVAPTMPSADRRSRTRSSAWRRSRLFSASLAARKGVASCDRRQTRAFSAAPKPTRAANSACQGPGSRGAARQAHLFRGEIGKAGDPAGEGEAAGEGGIDPHLHERPVGPQRTVAHQHAAGLVPDLDQPAFADQGRQPPGLHQRGAEIGRGHHHLADDAVAAGLDPPADLDAQRRIAGRLRRSLPQAIDGGERQHRVGPGQQGGVDPGRPRQRVGAAGGEGRRRFDQGRHIGGKDTAADHGGQCRALA